MMWFYMYPPTDGVTDLPFYVFSIGLHELQPRIDRPEGFDYDQFFFNCNGTGHLELNGQKYELPEGSAFFIPAHMPHCYYPDGEIWDIRWMTPAGHGLPGLYQKYHLEHGGIFTLRDETGLDQILNRMRMDIITHPKNGNVLAAGEVYSYIMEFIYQTSLYQDDETDGTPYEKQISVLKEYIGKHFMHPISLDDLCKVVPVSRQHLCRIFQRTLGERPMEYINRIRIVQAESLLIYTDLPIRDIAAQTGFKNTNYFNKNFLKYVHMTPKEYRNSVLHQ